MILKLFKSSRSFKVCTDEQLLLASILVLTRYVLTKLKTSAGLRNFEYYKVSLRVFKRPSIPSKIYVQLLSMTSCRLYESMLMSLVP